jgi:hypothetical protein
MDDRNLRKGGLVDDWEANAMRFIYRELRNPHSHGGGNDPPPPLSHSQQTWVIETCMSWIKRLVRP